MRVVALSVGPAAYVGRSMGKLTAFITGCALSFAPTLVLAQSELTELNISAQAVEFKPSRSDITTDGAMFLVGCMRKASDAERQLTGSTIVKCDSFRINGIDQSDFLSYSDMQMFSLNHFLLQSQKIEYSTEMGGYICISVHPLLNGIPNKLNAFYYAEEKDRYAMLSYCTVDTIPEWGWDNARLTHNRTSTLDTFLGVLPKIDVPMTDKPLPTRLDGNPFWGRDLASDKLYQCGYASPMPDGQMPQGSAEPISIPVGVYAKWEFSPDKRYHCQH